MATTAIKGETLELEIKHKVNSSWHPCRVTLSSSKAESSIIIDFENSNEEDIISNREDALTRLRFRSTPLKDGECSSIKEGDCVLAMYKDQFKSLFFDAVIEKPYRVKHSNRVFCRCSFEIKWLNPEMKDETMTIPSKAIMKLSREKIDCHSIFAAFLNALDPAEEVEVPSTLSFLEENNFEADFDGLLEKHIEEISRHADILMDCTSDLLLDVNRANYSGCKQSNSVVTRHTSSNCSSSNFRRSTRSQKKEQVKEEELKEGLQEDEELKKGLEKDKPFLSPLAARAALASYVHGYELPTKQKLSFSHVEKEGNTNLAQKELENYNTDHSFDETCESTRSGALLENCRTLLTNAIQISDNKQVGTKNKTNPKEPPCDEDKTVHTAEEPECQKGSTLTSANSSTSSTKAGKLSRRSMTTRVTRSSMHKELEAANEVKLGSYSKELSTSANTTSNTRSRNQNEHSYMSIDPEFRTSELIQNTHGISEESRNKKEESLTIVSNLVDSVRARVTRSSVHKEIEPSSDEVEQGEKLPDIVNTTRLTRSRGQKEQSTLDGHTSLRKTSMIEHTHEKFEDVTALQSESKKRSISSIVDLNTESHQDGSTVTSASGAVPNDSENASGELKKTRRKKIVSIKKPELRISPRLNFLPRTRSQKKA